MGDKFIKKEIKKHNQYDINSISGRSCIAKEIAMDRNVKSEHLILAKESIINKIFIDEKWLPFYTTCMWGLVVILLGFLLNLINDLPIVEKFENGKTFLLGVAILFGIVFIGYLKLLRGIERLLVNKVIIELVLAERKDMGLLGKDDN